MFIGSIRTPVQKSGDGPFFFFGPLKLSFCQLGPQTESILLDRWRATYRVSQWLLKLARDANSTANVVFPVHGVPVMRMLGRPRSEDMLKDKN